MVEETALEMAAECMMPCCRGDRWSPEEVAARKARRALSYETAAALLVEAAAAVRDGAVNQGRAFAEIADKWDQIGY